MLAHSPNRAPDSIQQESLIFHPTRILVNNPIQAPDSIQQESPIFHPIGILPISQTRHQISSNRNTIHIPNQAPHSIQ
jgi:hypothetical protein